MCVFQCHGSTGHCWCVDSRGQERTGTRTPPGAPPTDCDKPGEKDQLASRDGLCPSIQPHGGSSCAVTSVSRCIMSALPKASFSFNPLIPQLNDKSNRQQVYVSVCLTL